MSRQLGGSHDSVQVVERFALTHKDHVRQAVPLWQRVDLVQDVCGSQIPLESLPSCHAEAASHATSHLTAHAKSPPVAIRDVDRFHPLAVQGGEQVFHCAVLAALCQRVGHLPQRESFLQLGEALLRDIGHFFHAVRLVPVDPVCQLGTSEGRQANFCGCLPQFIQCHAQQRGLVSFQHGDLLYF